MQKAPDIMLILSLYSSSEWNCVLHKILSRDQIRLCLKNIAFLHAQFWKDQKTISESKPAKSEDIRENPEKIKKTINEYFNKLMASKWKAHGLLRPPRDHVVASWLTIEVSGDFSLSCFGYTINGYILQMTTDTLFWMILWSRKCSMS